MLILDFGRLRAAFLENLSIAFGIFGSLFFVLILFLPSISSLPVVEHKIKDKKSELNELKNKSVLLDNLISSQTALKENLELVDVAIPSKDNVPTLMTQIQRIASESGVVLKALQFNASLIAASASRSAADKSFKKVNLNAVTEGSFSNLTTFLRNLEGASRIVEVETLSFEVKKGGERVTANLGLSAYYYNKTQGTALGNFSLSDSDVKIVNEKLKSLKVYRMEATSSGIGKANPFE